MTSIAHGISEPPIPPAPGAARQYAVRFREIARTYIHDKRSTAIDRYNAANRELWFVVNNVDAEFPDLHFREAVIREIETLS